MLVHGLFRARLRLQKIFFVALEQPNRLIDRQLAAHLRASRTVSTARSPVASGRPRTHPPSWPQRRSLCANALPNRLLPRLPLFLNLPKEAREKRMVAAARERPRAIAGRLKTHRCFVANEAAQRARVTSWLTSRRNSSKRACSHAEDDGAGAMADESALAIAENGQWRFFD